jgi:uncharacterized protein (TIGR02391 family)
MSTSKNRRTIKIPLNNEFTRQFARDRKFRFINSHILEDLAFPEYQDESPYETTKRTVVAMEMGGCAKEKMFAFIKTGRMLSVANVKFTSSEDKKEWTDAIKQYKKLVLSGALQASDSLVPFIQDSKDVLNPIKSKKELETLFDGRNFHKSVVDCARNQFINYDFPNAVFNSYKRLLVTIKEKSGNFNDGTPLVTSVFNPKTPILQSSLARFTEDTSIQEGIMHLFMGAVLSIRNVFAHKDVYLTDSDDTLEYLSFSSFLFKIVDVLELNQTEKTEKHK